MNTHDGNFKRAGTHSDISHGNENMKIFQNFRLTIYDVFGFAS